MGSYWQLPERLYDDPEELTDWANAALAAAMHVIAVTTPYTREQFRTTEILNRRFVVDDPTLLPDAVKKILGK